jgi:hypothetical protein
VVNAPESIPAPASPSGARDSRDVAATRRFIAVAGFLSVAAALALALAEASGHQLDFDIYRMGATQVAGRHLYSTRVRIPGMHGPGMRFTYPPFAALMFWPFTWLSVSGGQFGWAIFNVIVLAAIATVTLHTLRPDWSYQRIGVIVAVALFPALRLSPALLTLDLGQVNLFIALLVLVDLTCVVGVRTHALPRGVLVGIAAAIKLTPLIFIPFLLLTRQFRAACTAVGTFLLCSLLAAVVAPHSSALYWTQDVFDYRRSGNLMYISDQNAHSALQRLLGVPPSPLLAGALTLALAAGGLAVATWAYRASSPMLGILLCATTGLVPSLRLGPAGHRLAGAGSRPARGRTVVGPRRSSPVLGCSHLVDTGQGPAMGIRRAAGPAGRQLVLPGRRRLPHPGHPAAVVPPVGHGSWRARCPPARGHH